MTAKPRRHGYDSVAATAAEWRRIVPTADPDVIGSYRNGRFANDAAAAAAFPRATHVSYDVNGSRPDADILDVENFDATPAQCPGWSRRYKGRLPRPSLYCSASAVADVVTAMLDHGFRREEFQVQSAHYGAGPHVCGPAVCGFPQADGTQYTDKGVSGQNTDLSLFEDHFFAPTRPAHDPHYDYFDNARRRFLTFQTTERSAVQEYDKWRATQSAKHHPHRVRLAVLRVQLGWFARRLEGLQRQQRTQRYHRDWRIRELRARAAGKRPA